MSERVLHFAKRFMVKELISYQDELFSLLFRDISGFSQDVSDRVFGQSDRRISIYGVRGLGKTTAMQGVFWTGLVEEKADNYIPVNIVVSDVRGIESPRQLSDLFYRSLIHGVSRVTKAAGLKEDLLKTAGHYAPWVARKITEAVGILFGPVALASDLSEKGVKWLVERLRYSNIDYLIASKSLDSQQAATLLIDKLEDLDGKPIFLIDELDKVEDDTVLSDFFDGNQAWFQGKQGIISLIHFRRVFKEDFSYVCKPYFKHREVPRYHFNKRCRRNNKEESYAWTLTDRKDRRSGKGGSDRNDSRRDN